MNTGYREMLRDRCPKVVSHALKWCKAKEAWLNHVYKNFIWIYSGKQDRLEATKIILGYRNTPKKFNFEDTILWDNLSDEDTKYWKSVKGWVSWFQSRYAYIENTYRVSLSKGIEIEDIKYDIMLNWLLDMCPKVEDDQETKEKKNKVVNNFVDFLIDCFENRI